MLETAEQVATGQFRATIVRPLGSLRQHISLKKFEMTEVFGQFYAENDEHPAAARARMRIEGARDA
jgi:hypothetical protein